MSLTLTQVRFLLKLEKPRTSMEGAAKDSEISYGWFNSWTKDKEFVKQLERITKGDYLERGRAIAELYTIIIKEAEEKTRCYLEQAQEDHRNKALQEFNENY